jgi:hypothetical protein
MATKKPLGIYAGEVEGFAVGDFVDITNGGTGAITKTAGFDNLSPNTTKGDIVVHNGTNNIRLPTGSNGYVLTADSTQGSGIKWAAASGGSSGTTVTGVLKGDGTNIIQAVADTDYVSVSTFSNTMQDFESAYRLGDRRAETYSYDKIMSTAPITPTSVQYAFRISDVNVGAQWEPDTSIHYITLAGGVTDTRYAPISTDRTAAVTIGYTQPGLLKAVWEGAFTTYTTQIAVAGTDYALPSQSVPTGGTVGQVLAKNSSTNNDVGWVNGISITSQEVYLGWDWVNNRWKNTDSDTITITVSGATVGQRVIVTPSSVPGTGAGSGWIEPAPYSGMELNMFVCSAYVSAPNTVILSAVSVKGTLRGYYTINILIG